MSRGLRAAFVVGPVAAAAVIAFLVLRSGGDGTDPVQSPTTPVATTATETMAATDASTDVATTAESAPEPAPVSIRVENGEPVGGPAEIEVRKNDVVRFVVASDVDDEVHVHGYDLSKSVGPGREASFRFDAEIEGIFEIELEGRAVEIATLVVRPR